MKKSAAIFGITGALLLGYWLTVRIQERMFQSEASNRTSIDPHEDPAAGNNSTAPVTPHSFKAPRRLDPGSVIGRLSIPRIGLSVVVVEGAGEKQLRLAAGHIPGTALPGEHSNVAFAAHRDTHFRPLRSVRLDDEVEVAAGAEIYRYRIVSTKIVKPEDIQVLYPTERETLTLVTCYPLAYVGAAPSRFIVRAECTNCAPWNPNVFRQAP